MLNFILDKNLVLRTLVLTCTRMTSIYSVPMSSSIPNYSSNSKPTMYLGYQLCKMVMSSNAEVRT